MELFGAIDSGVLKLELVICVFSTRPVEVVILCPRTLLTVNVFRTHSGFERNLSNCAGMV